MRTARALIVLAFIADLAPAAAGGSRQAEPATIRAPHVVAVKTGLNGPAAFTFGPNAKIWFAERGTGEIRVLDRESGTTRLFFDVSNVDGSGERGALGLALHPDYPASPFVYLYVTRTDHGDLVNELLRIRSEQGRGVSFQVLFRWAVSGAPNHNGGRIVFGADGNLFIVTGDNANPANSQRVANLRGKILRIRPDGSIPADNPFGTRVFAYGIRNSFGMAVDPFTDDLWETENGPSCNDEVNRILGGGNFAWGPSNACPADPLDAVAADTNRDGPSPRRFPKALFEETIGITGAAFCDACGLGATRQGDLIFGDVNTGGIWALSLNDARTDADGEALRFLSAGTAVYSVEAGPGGVIYFSGPSGIYKLAS